MSYLEMKIYLKNIKYNLNPPGKVHLSVLVSTVIS